MAQQAASDDLAAARSDLQQADTALQQKRPLAEVDHLAYLAERHAQAGTARVAAAQAQAQVNNASLDRSRVLLEARAREAANAKEQLAATQQQLADLQAKQTDRGVVVTMGDVLFDTGRATLKPGAVSVIERLAAYMQSNPQTRLVDRGPHRQHRLAGHQRGALATPRRCGGERADRARRLGAEPACGRQGPGSAGGQQRHGRRAPAEPSRRGDLLRP